MQDAMTLEQRIARLEALEAIRELKHRYLNACDLKDVAAIRDCFAQGPVLIDYGPLVAIGAIALGVLGLITVATGTTLAVGPLLLAVAGVAVLWRQADEAQRERWLDSSGRLNPLRAVVGHGGWAAYLRIIAGVLSCGPASQSGSRLPARISAMARGSGGVLPGRSVSAAMIRATVVAVADRESGCRSLPMRAARMRHFLGDNRATPSRRDDHFHGLPERSVTTYVVSSSGSRPDHS